MNIRWDYFVNQYDASRYVASADGRDNRHIQFVREFASVVSVLQDKTNNVIDLYKDILRAVEDLATCSYTIEAFSELLAKIQAAVSFPCVELSRSPTYVRLLDRSFKLGGVRQPRALGGGSRQADRRHPVTTPCTYHQSMVCRV